MGAKVRYALPIPGDKAGDEKGEGEKGGGEKGELAPEEEWTYPEGGKGWRVVLGCWLYAGSTMVRLPERTKRVRGVEGRADLMRDCW